MAAHDGLTDAFDADSMGLSTERGNIRLNISRTAQDEVAAASHQRAAAAAAAGVFDAEIVPVTVPQRKGEPLVLNQDEGIRAADNRGDPCRTAPRLHGRRRHHGRQLLAPLRRRQRPGAVLPRLRARSTALRGWPWWAPPARWQDRTTRCIPNPPTPSPRPWTPPGGVLATLTSLRSTRPLAPLPSSRCTILACPLEKCNIHGGAIALGHPIGASGARLALHAALELSRRGSGKAAVSLCGGGGQGEALLLFRDAQ